MNTRKRIGIVAFLVVGMTLLASDYAHARNWSSWGRIQLTNIGDEPRASGSASLTRVTPCPELSDEFHIIYRGQLSLKCTKLMPGVTYITSAGSFTANRSGTGRVTRVGYFIAFQRGGWGELIPVPFEVKVSRLNADGTNTPVLAGTIDHAPAKQK